MAKKNKKIGIHETKEGSMTAKTEEKSVRVPLIAIKYGIGILCVVVVCMMWAAVYYRQNLHMGSAERIELENLRKDNAAQAKQIEELSKTTVSLQADMERLNSLDNEVRRIINNDEGAGNTSRSGVQRNSGKYTGQGGPDTKLTTSEIANVTNHLQTAVKEREESLIELKQGLLDKEAKMATRPSIWPTMGDVTSQFGWRNSPNDGSSDYHPGVDIANNVGTPVVATADGKVIISGRSSGYGNLIEIDHGNGITTFYGHNSQLIVQVGQMVKKGQMIAYMGSTGNSTGPHVHYEIRMNGTPVNPANFLN